jgi:hypothetical protein
MKHLQSIILLIILAASTTPAQFRGNMSASQRKVELQLIDLERQLSDALVKGDAATLDRLWSNDHVYVPNGKVTGKAQRWACSGLARDRLLLLSCGRAAQAQR